MDGNSAYRQSSYRDHDYEEEDDGYSGDVVESSYSDDAEGSPDPDVRMLTPTQFPDRSVRPKQQRLGSRRLVAAGDATYALGILKPRHPRHLDSLGGGRNELCFWSKQCCWCFKEQNHGFRRFSLPNRSEA